VLARGAVTWRQRWQKPLAAGHPVALLPLRHSVFKSRQLKHVSAGTHSVMWPHITACHVSDTALPGGFTDSKH
jgi:hypothetical protein